MIFALRRFIVGRHNDRTIDFLPKNRFIVLLSRMGGLNKLNRLLRCMSMRMMVLKLKIWSLRNWILILHELLKIFF